MRSNNSKKPHLTNAIDEEGNWKHINEVESGLACKCFCPHCRARLIAINSKPESESKVHHFAHERGSDCVWSDESSLHKLAKEVLAEEQKIMLPLIQGETHERQLEFDCVKPESRDPETGLIPDCVCYYGGQKLWVEFKRTHEVDKKKADKIRNAKIDCIEINLNVCKINKDAVRQFIVEQSTDRIWIYNSRTQQTKVWKERGCRKEAEYSEHDYILIDRHIAYDENKYLVNLYRIDSTYDISAHRYYCINCGKEVKYVDGHFEHVEENKKCVDGIYLIEAAKEVIYNSFYNSEKYEISVPKFHFCKNINDCIFADRNRCLSEGCETYDLKSKGYVMCEKNFKRPGQNEIYDIVFRKGQSLEDAIFIVFSTEDCERDLDTSFCLIEIHISEENDVMRLTETLNNGYCRNFNEESTNQATPEEIKTQVLKFSLYRSGNYYLSPVDCTTLDLPRNREVVYEFMFQGNIPPTNSEPNRQFSLLSCYERNHIACYCEICAYLKRNPGRHPICIRYKTKNKPRNPLASKPVQCDAFRLDKDLAKNLRDEYKNVKLIEPDYKS